MVIEQLTLNVPKGSGPVEVLAELPEMYALMSLIGWRRPTAWWVGVFAVIDHARGKTPSVILSPTQTLQLCHAAISAAGEDVPDSPVRPPAPSMLHTGVLAIDTELQDTRHHVINTILDYSIVSPPRHEEL